jgi:hypothetical protein
MGELLHMPTKGPLEQIACRFVDRKWMRAAKSWRCTIALPDSAVLPSMLTGLIEDKVEVQLRGDVDVTIAPVFIVDVPSKGKRFFLVFETCYEHQAPVGPMLTALTDTPITMTILKFTEPAAIPKVNTDPLTDAEIRGLHVGFFRNERFREFLEEQQAGTDPIDTPETAKVAFKQLLGVKSCKDLTRERFLPFVAKFNAWCKDRT